MLSIVSTPIGNLGDITIRALNVLKEAEKIICEDTRQTQKLLKHYDFSKKLISYHEHSSNNKRDCILNLLKKGAHLALVSDGGTPLISDPGFDILQRAVSLGIPLQVLPGPSSVIMALVASSLAVDSFSFFGFLPVKGGKRKKQLVELSERKETLIFFESPYRVLKTLSAMQEVFGDREAVIAREMTKKFEEILRGTISELISKISEKEIKGEIVLLVSGKDRKKILLKGNE